VQQLSARALEDDLPDFKHVRPTGNLQRLEGRKGAG
jgi:hypothetical protein